MPSYNSSEVIEEAIKSVLDQTYQIWELLIIDDGSNDETIKIISPYLEDPRIKLYQMGKNSGVAMARNKGIQKGIGRYVAFLDSDDVWHPDKLEIQLEYLIKHKGFLVYSNYNTFYESIVYPEKKIQVPSEITYEELLRNTIIGCLTVMVDRKRTGDFLMPNIQGGEDTATWLTLLKKYGPAHGVQECLAYYRLSSQSISSNKWRMAYRTWKMYRITQSLSLRKTLFCFSHYIFHAVLKRI
ncbi:glycosyltransferase family 2 protein [Carnobacterium maltaromaticum]|uniref:glycosyltransferase family 2 protein n=1 Tax=Carnobacterium maltaromaticum TaxID=2751 RepID=UPI001F4253ED|nr:glycosyltransferase family A protein [Carnobacterium maltaromaticum]